jgi:hypothetical protein
MPFGFAPCLTGFTTEPAVAASKHHYETCADLSRISNKTDICDKIKKIEMNAKS